MWLVFMTYNVNSCISSVEHIVFHSCQIYNYYYEKSVCASVACRFYGSLTAPLFSNNTIYQSLVMVAAHGWMLISGATRGINTFIIYLKWFPANASQVFSLLILSGMWFNVFTSTNCRWTEVITNEGKWWKIFRGVRVHTCSLLIARGVIKTK